MDLEQQQRIYGDSGPWTRYLARAWRLAAGAVDVSPPDIFTAIRENDEFGPAPGCAWWSPLLNLMRYRLGWADPAAGAATWWERGLPTDDPTLAAIQLWYGEHLALGIQWLTRDLAPIDGLNERADRARRSGSTLDLFDGGWDPFHLSGHVGAPENLHQGPKPSREVWWAPGVSLRTSLVWPTYVGWYAYLMEFYDEYVREASGPQDDGQPPLSLTIEPIGWLGLFRPSARSMRWHATSPEIHAWGNP